MKTSSLLNKHPIYAATEATMRDYQAAYLGGTTFKRSVRQKRPNEDEKLYSDVLTNTSALPVARYIVDTINDTVFSQPIHREICFSTPTGVELDSDSTEWSELIIYDADLTNRSLDAVMENIGDLTSIFGHCWVFVDMPSVEQGPGGRPYVVAVSPLQVWDWNFVPVNGRYIPGYIKVLEHEDSEHYRFRCYHLGTTTSPSYWETYIVRKGDNMAGDIPAASRGEFPRGMSIPGFLAYTRRDPRTAEIGVSDIDSASDVQRELYKLETEAYQSIQFARTLIRADAGVKVPAHAGGIVRASEGQIETLSVDTQDVNNIIAKQDALLLSLENLSGFGGLRQSRQTVQSGISLIEERRQLHKVAKAKARQLEVCEELIWTYVARYMGVRWSGEVCYGTDYEAADTKYQIALLQTAQQLSGTNPVVQSVIDARVLELIADEEELPLLQQQMRAARGEEEEEEEEREYETRDIGDQTPQTLPSSLRDNGDNNIAAGYPGIKYTGVSSVNPAADMLMQSAISPGSGR